MAQSKKTLSKSNLCRGAILIFISVGTTYRFEPLVKAIDQIAPKIKEKIIIQTGRSRYKPKNCGYFRFKPSLSPYIKKASLVIAHGGAGTTYEVLKSGKKLISIDNPNVNDSHQPDLLGQLSKEKYCLWCNDPQKIHDFIIKSKKFKFRKYKSPSCKIHKRINEFLEN